MTAFLAGMIAFGFGVSALFFIRFWRKTHDRLFAFFAYAFGLMAAEQTVLSVTGRASDPTYFHVYLLRLAAFVLIIFAIIDKNRSRDGRPS